MGAGSLSHGIPVEIPWEWDHTYAKNWNGNGKSTRDMGTGMATFSSVPKFPWVNLIRMQPS